MITRGQIRDTMNDVDKTTDRIPAYHCGDED
jgi:hypothetical protein